MVFFRHYLKDHNFMYTKISGEVNDQNLKQHVADLNKETEGVSNLIELADCREISCLEKLTVQGTAKSAAIERARQDSLLAILVSDSTLLFGLARTYQAFSEDRRKDTQIFKNLNDALTWLTRDDKERELFKEFIEKGKL